MRQSRIKRVWYQHQLFIADFGEELPFKHIRETEGRLIDVLFGLFTRYGLQCPKTNHDDTFGNNPYSNESNEAIFDKSVCIFRALALIQYYITLTRQFIAKAKHRNYPDRVTMLSIGVIPLRATRASGRN